MQQAYQYIYELWNDIYVTRKNLYHTKRIDLTELSTSTNTFCYYVCNCLRKMIYKT